MKKLMLILILLIIAGLALELYVLLQVIIWFQDILGPLMVLAALSYLGYRVVRFHISRMPQSFISGAPGPRLIGLIGGLLLAIPGFISAMIGLLLQIPVIQRQFGKLGQALGASLAKRVLGRSGFFAGMQGMGGMPGMPPGFAGFRGFGGLTPDDHVRKPSRTYETTLERDPDKLR